VQVKDGPGTITLQEAPDARPVSQLYDFKELPRIPHAWIIAQDDVTCRDSKRAQLCIFGGLRVVAGYLAIDLRCGR
jgi:hypothetical protein